MNLFKSKPPSLRTIVLFALTAFAAAAADGADWFAFDPPADLFSESAIDLRSLNEKFAGEHGVIAARGDEFIHSANGQPVRFWAVNGPPGDLRGDALKQCARRLAKYGVNLAPQTVYYLVTRTP